jgi:hypothetical protein
MLGSWTGLVSPVNSYVVSGVAIPIASVNAADAEFPAESSTFTVKVEVPVDVGVPLKIPEVESVTPAGGEPAFTVHAYPAPLPPVPISVAL